MTLAIYPKLKWKLIGMQIFPWWWHEPYKSSAVVGGGQPAFRVYVRVCLSGALALQANVYMKNHYRLPSVVCCTRYIKLYIWI